MQRKRFYIIGSNNTQTKFRVLKIDRTEPHELVVVDDQIEYSSKQMKDMLNTIHAGNKNTSLKSTGTGFVRIVSAFGIVGFVRFLEGYYLVLITKRRQVAKVGYHSVYKIEDTYVAYIPNTGDKHSSSSEESRYLKTFLNVDLSSNFYFSYSYDLTHTLQYNLSPFSKAPEVPSETPGESETPEEGDGHAPCPGQPEGRKKVVAASMKPEWKFVWNEYLLNPVKNIHPEWKIYVIHGFVGQSNISIFSKPLFLTLIGRRANKFAGTRFLKRGSNLQGGVANEVETEQILHDSSISSLQNGLFSSFVQMRGSVPFQWSQDVSKMVPKPQITRFVRFLEGYYLVLITKRRQVAKVGYHSVYKIEDTYVAYIPNTGDKHSSSSEESRYSYDLTHTLQYNLSPFSKAPEVPSETPGESETPEEGDGHAPCPGQPEGRKKVVAASMKPEWKFVWNEYLLNPVKNIHPEWKIYVIHGFVGQSNISIFSKPLFLTLIGRRANKFAGTRFLKRGSNLQGGVANEVETEQILHDSSISSLQNGLFSSFVQMRGSVPFQWSQDVSKMVPKPQITLDSIDPYSQAAGQHFKSLLHQYGAPVIALNLVKKREQKPQESILMEQYLSTIAYLNQFLAPPFHIIHVGFDMARVNKQLSKTSSVIGLPTPMYGNRVVCVTRKEPSVMNRLSDIAAYVVKKVGFFQNWAPYHAQRHHTNSCCFYNRRYKNPHGPGFFQTGVVRVNCVDCLDRTNTAQFALGKTALAFQLHAMGMIDTPSLQFDSDIVRMLEELYEDHGDVLALQYGGSQLVHRIKTYRKIAPLSSQSRDIMQTLSRYYSNTFSDADKQNAINLFLGVYKAWCQTTPLWDLTTDYYLHNPEAAGHHPCCRSSLTCWFGEEVTEHLPLPLNQAIKGQQGTVEHVFYGEPEHEKINGFYDFYKPYEFTILSDHFSFKVSHSVRDFMPSFTTDFSPFSVRLRLGRRREVPPNPSVCGISSSSSGNSDTDSGDSDSDNPFLQDSVESSSTDSSSTHFTFKTHFPTMKKTYGVEITEPNDMDKSLYKSLPPTPNAITECIDGIILVDVKSPITDKHCDRIPTVGAAGDLAAEVARPLVAHDLPEVSSLGVEPWVERGHP
ncbi:FIG4 [Cordylochernes scorpioides]|uniref:FIG4 n=1 Tax=Cordylochernes scorpioides TaxID=51811 RepID=A0ABY6L7T2_9ARAC|nr:FIG4 [Cordylochernes scorpioides]